MHRSVQKTLILITLFFLVSACNRTEQQPPNNTIKSFILNPGDTLTESLKDSGFSPAASTEIINGLSSVTDLRRCRAGDRYEVTFDPAGQWLHRDYYTSGMNFYSLEKSTGGTVSAAKQTLADSKAIETATGQIRTSLWEAMASKKISPEIINDLADIFAWQIDFLTEPRAGDSYKLVWEKFSTSTGVLISGRILAAQYIASGRTYTAVLYTDAQGQDNYYSPDGKSLKRAFLKAPLQYRRISSFFTRRRFHPVLKIFRPHLGIDYAAPKGTPVSSIGEGTVVFAGRKGGFGKFIQVRHANGYASCYGHLAGFAKGIASGTHVRQGQVIGYVGATGLATGPHLYFELWERHRRVDPLIREPVTTARLDGRARRRFAAFIRRLDA